MKHSKLYQLGVALLPLCLMGWPAMADSFNLMSNDGPIRLHIDRDGDVHGEYPKRQGIIRGHIGQDGNIHGVWMQPTSDHPCRQVHGDTHSWGFFMISNLYRRNVAGSWGYCDEQPIRDWAIERD